MPTRRQSSASLSGDFLASELSSLFISSYNRGRTTGSGGRGQGRGNGGRFAGPAGSSSASARHNVARVPELDYFCRKLARRDGDGVIDPRWNLSFAKAGAAKALPDNYADVTAYLDAMQSAVALEFQAAVQEALDQADRDEWRTGASGYHQFCPQKITSSDGYGSPTSAAALRYVGAGGGLDFETDSWGKHLVQVKETQSFHVAVMAKVDEETGQHVLAVLPTVELDGHYSKQYCIRSLGYIGPFLAQYDSAQLLRYEYWTSLLPTSTRELLCAVAKPSSWRATAASGTLLTAGSSSTIKLRTDKVPVNKSQREAVKGLRGGLDIIHGPPGTGKSTTIFHIIDSRVQRDEQVLVTCTRNQAVDSIADKVALLDGGILVFGNPARLGPNAAKYTLAAQVEGHPDVEAWKCSLGELQKLEKELETFWGYSTAVRRRGMVAAALSTALDRGRFDRKLHEALSDAITVIVTRILEPLRAKVKKQLLENARVFVCTIDSTSRMVYDLAELEVQLKLDTVIVDEAGCVLESAIPMLLRLHPSNLILIGDHKQLQAFSCLMDPPRNHCRSLMERAVNAGVPATMLAEQYRMHPQICAAISKTFYAGTLKSGPGMLTHRPCSRPCRLVDVDGEEEHHKGGGFSNHDEALEAIWQAEAAAAELRQQGVTANGSKQPTLFIITLYNRQRGLILDLLRDEGTEDRLKDAGWDVSVLSADACQGSEADVVVLSTVRNTTASRSSGAPLSRFFNDARRLNVALSRARQLCVVVGSAATILQAARRKPMWRAITDHYKVA